MLLEWWNDIVAWFTSSAGQRVFTTAILPFIAILAAGLIAGLITRSAVKRLINQQERRFKSAAVETLIAAGRKAAEWHALTAQEKEYVEHQIAESEVRVRMLPSSGASLAADWSAHKIASMKRNSANYTFQAEQDLAEFQEGLISWHAKPSQAKKLFAQDLAEWKYEGGPIEDDLLVKQREWAAAQNTETLQTTS